MTLPINHKLTKTEINELENCKNGCELINFWNNIDKKREKGGNKMKKHKITEIINLLDYLLDNKVDNINLPKTKKNIKLLETLVRILKEETK